MLPFLATMPQLRLSATRNSCLPDCESCYMLRDVSLTMCCLPGRSITIYSSDKVLTISPGEIWPCARLRTASAACTGCAHSCRLRLTGPQRNVSAPHQPPHQLAQGQGKTLVQMRQNHMSSTDIHRLMSMAAQSEQGREIFRCRKASLRRIQSAAGA